MLLKMRPLAPKIGLEIVDFDLARDLNDATFTLIEQAFNEHGLLLFRRQRINERDHIEISRRFGRLQDHVLKPFLLPDFPQILRISNIEQDGKPIGIGDAGLYWHSDTSYTAHPCRCSLLYAIQIPDKENGRSFGDTIFGSLTAAYDALDESTRIMLEPLKAEHSYGKHYQRMQAAGSKRPDLTEEQKKEVPKVIHPVIRPHPITGRKAIYVNDGYTTHILDKDDDESATLLQTLFEHTVKPEFTYRHHWEVDDLLIWDNSSTQHLAINDYALPQRRLLHRTTVLDERS